MERGAGMLKSLSEIFPCEKCFKLFHTGKACTANLCIAFHDGAVVDIIPAPHISNTVLSVGGRIWALWKSVELVKTKLHSQIFLVKRNGFFKSNDEMYRKVLY